METVCFSVCDRDTPFWKQFVFPSVIEVPLFLRLMDELGRGGIGSLFFHSCLSGLSEVSALSFFGFVCTCFALYCCGASFLLCTVQLYSVTELTVSKAVLGELLKEGLERIWAFPSA